MLAQAAGHPRRLQPPSRRPHRCDGALPGRAAAAHEQATTYPFQTYIGGHLTRLGTRSDVETQQEYISEVRAQAVNALQTVNVSAIYASVDPANPWAVFRAYLGAGRVSIASARRWMAPGTAGCR